MTVLDIPDALTIAVKAVAARLSSTGINPYTLASDDTGCHCTLEGVVGQPVTITWTIERRPDGVAVLLAAASGLRDQCSQFEIPLFFKQVGGRAPTAGGDELDGVRHKQFPER